MMKKTESKEKSVNHFLRVTEKLQGFKAVCLPLTIRLGETKGGIRSKDIIVFDMLTGYEIGFPDDEEDRKSLLKAICGAVSIVHSLGVIHMDIYLSNIMWKKLEDGSFDVKIIDLDAAQDRDAKKLTDNVLKRLADEEGDLLKLCGFEPTLKFDNVYLDMFQKNLDDSKLRLARNDEELKNGDVLKGRLDRRCTQLKRDFLAEKLKKSVA
jgi:serine/threonine protein kinase